MNKKLYIVMAAAALTVGATSCSDFLDEDNKTGTTAQTEYVTESGLKGLVASTYSFARGWYGKEPALGLAEMGTDLFYYGFDCKQKSLVSYNFGAESLGNNVQNNPCLDQYWELFYNAVDVCNNAIEQVHSTKINSLTTKTVRIWLLRLSLCAAFIISIWLICGVLYLIMKRILMLQTAQEPCP